MSISSFNAASASDSKMTISEDGDKIWTNTKGQWHRLDGPAFEWADGAKQWHINNKLHRLDGPAYEEPDGTKAWYIDGKKLTEKEFNQHPDVLAFQRDRQAELAATEKAEAEAKKRKLDEMHKVLGAVVRDFHRKFGGLQ